MILRLDSTIHFRPEDGVIQKLLLETIYGMIEYYHIKNNSSESYHFREYSLSDTNGMKNLCEFIKRKHKITLIPFKFEAENGPVIASGFDLVEDNHLTKYILTLDKQ